MFFGPDGIQLPEEIEEAIRAQLDRAEMSADATRHDVLRFFDELDPEQLKTFRMLIHHCASDESGRYASHLEGLISGILQYKHGLCMGCGKRHDDPSELVKEGIPNHVEKDDPLLIEDGTKQLELFAQEEAESVSAKMEEYGVRPPDQRDFQAGLIMMPEEKPVLCIQCNFLWQTLEDRMLRPPGVDGCPGCQHKAAHG